jgi:hypothetical protein
MTAMRLCPAARAGSSSASKGEYPIRMPRAWRMSSGSVMITGTGRHLSCASATTVSTASTLPHAAAVRQWKSQCRSTARRPPAGSCARAPSAGTVRSAARPAGQHRAHGHARVLPGRIVRLDELARLAAAARIRTARHPTIGAQLAQRPCTDFWRIKTTGSRPAIKFSEPERDGTSFHTQQQR